MAQIAGLRLKERWARSNCEPFALAGNTHFPYTDASGPGGCVLGIRPADPA